MSNFKFYQDFVPVPKDFIENVMPTANASFVTVYLYIMLLAVNGKSSDTAAIAQKLNLLESDVIHAVKYWHEKGVFSGSGDNIIIKRSIDEELSHAANKKSIGDISEIIKGNSTLRDLCAIAQEILGKTLANNDIETLYWFYDTLGFSPEVITMLLEYCVSMDKRNIKYIEKVALTWSENNITSMDEAQQYINRVTKKDEYTSSLCKLFGITDRKLSKTEQMYLDAWRDEFKMSADMVSLAYEYCIMATNKFSFPYINTILKRWAEQNIRTIQDAEKDHENHRSSSREKSISTDDRISDIEKQFINNY